MPDTYITVVGNSTADAELRFMPNGQAVSNFSIASTPRQKVNDEWVDGETAFYRVSAFRALAEECSEQIRRGTKLIVTGKFKVKSWEKDGVKRTDLTIDADEIGISLRAKKAAATSNAGWGTPAADEKAPF